MANGSNIFQMLLVCSIVVIATSILGRVRSTVMSMPVCLSVSLSVRSHVINRTAELRQIFLHILPVSVAPFSSDGAAIRYVLPVLWMTSCFHITGSTARHAYAYDSSTAPTRPKITIKHQ